MKKIIKGISVLLTVCLLLSVTGISALAETPENERVKEEQQLAPAEVTVVVDAPPVETPTGQTSPAETPTAPSKARSSPSSMSTSRTPAVNRPRMAPPSMTSPVFISLSLLSVQHPKRSCVRSIRSAIFTPNGQRLSQL